MTIRTALVACAVALATLAAPSAANAGDPYGGFGPSEAPAQNVGAESGTAAPAPDDATTLPWLRQQSQTQPDNYGGEWYERRAVQDDGSDVDDASGH
jgi:hypothetical protein